MTAIWHITPVNDLERHIEGMTCKCNPVKKQIGEDEFTIVHNSFDGREAVEMANEIINGHGTRKA